MVASPDPVFKLDRLSSVDEDVRQLTERATALGLRATLAAALQRVVERLQTDPLGWSDPEFNTKHQGGTVRHGIEQPIVVRFVVFEAERCVCILQVRPFPGSPLDQSE